jgi:hypothetical protein
MFTNILRKRLETTVALHEAQPRSDQALMR